MVVAVGTLVVSVAATVVTRVMVLQAGTREVEVAEEVAVVTDSETVVAAVVAKAVMTVAVLEAAVVVATVDDAVVARVAVRAEVRVVA